MLTGEGDHEGGWGDHACIGRLLLQFQQLQTLFLGPGGWIIYESMVVSSSPVGHCHLQVGCLEEIYRCRWGEYVTKTTITAHAESERCCCVNYTQSLLPIASDNQPAKGSTWLS